MKHFYFYLKIAMAGGGGESGAYLIKLRNYATMKFKDFDWLKKVT